MGVEIPVGYAQITYKFLCTGRATPACTTIGVFNGDAFTAAELAEGANTALVGSGLITGNVMVAGWTYIGADSVLQTITGPFVGAYAETIVGTLAGGALPANCAILVEKGTARGGRAGKGRMYWPPLLWPETSVGPDGVASGATYGAVQAKMTTFLVNLGVTAGEPMLFHSNGGTPDPILTLRVGSLIATQRRRLR